MSCPTCNQTMCLLTEQGDCRYLWCRRCGTVKTVTGASKDHDSPTALRVLLNVCRHLVGAYDEARDFAQPVTLSGQVIDRAREALECFTPAVAATPTPPVAANCPDCGKVTLVPDVWDKSNPVSGVCPKCGDRIYFSK